MASTIALVEWTTLYTGKNQRTLMLAEKNYSKRKMSEKS